MRKPFLSPAAGEQASSLTFPQHFFTEGQHWARQMLRQALRTHMLKVSGQAGSSQLLLQPPAPPVSCLYPAGNPHWTLCRA